MEHLLKKLEEGKKLTFDEAQGLAVEIRIIFRDSQTPETNKNLIAAFKDLLPKGLDDKQQINEYRWLNSLNAAELTHIFLRHDILSGNGFDKYIGEKGQYTILEPLNIDRLEDEISRMVKFPDMNREVLKNAKELSLIEPPSFTLDEPAALPIVWDLVHELKSEIYLPHIKEKNGRNSEDAYALLTNIDPDFTHENGLSQEALLNIADDLSKKPSNAGISKTMEGIEYKNTYKEIGQNVLSQLRFPESTYKGRIDLYKKSLAEFENSSEHSVKDLSKNWSEFSQDQQLGFAKQIAKTYYKNARSSEREIILDNSIDVRGEYAGKEINLNFNLFNKDIPDEENFLGFLKTLYHEINHSWQHDQKLKLEQGFTQTEDEKFSGRLTKVNFKF